MRQILRTGILLLALAAGAAAQTAAGPAPAPAAPEEPALLQPGKPVLRTLAGGAAQSFRVQLQAGDFLRLVVDQRGIDVVVALYGPDGKKLVEVDSPNGPLGPEPLCWIAQEGGSYRLEVRSGDPSVPAGEYDARIEEERPATAPDRQRVEAEAMVGNANQLFGQGTPDSLRQAIEQYRKAAGLIATLGERHRQGEVLMFIAKVQLAISDFRAAAETDSQALPLLQEKGAEMEYDNALNDLGLAYAGLGEWSKEADCFQKVLEDLRRLGGRTRLESEPIVLSNLGYAYQRLGENRKALDYYAQSLEGCRAARNRSCEATTLANLGGVYEDLGEFQKAIDAYQQSLGIAREIKDQAVQATALDDLGLILKHLGDSQGALDNYQQALVLFRSLGDRQHEATLLGNLAVVYEDRGERAKALESYQQALALDRQIGDRPGEGTDLSNLGFFYQEQGDHEQALALYQQALALRRQIGDRPGQAYTLALLGRLSRAQGDDRKALEFFQQSLALDREVGLRGEEAGALFQIARAERALGNLKDARAHIEDCLKIVEGLRGSIAGEQLRTSYFSTVQNYYRFYIELLMQMHRQDPQGGYAAAALEVGERARARSLLELLAEAHVDIRRGVDPALLQRESALAQRLGAAARRQTELLSRQHTQEEAGAAAKEIQDLTGQYQEVETEIRAKSPRYAALTQPQPVSLADIQQRLLDPDTLLLEYVLAEERSYLWAVTPSGMAIHELPKREDIESLARSAYEALLRSGKEQRGFETAATAPSSQQQLDRDLRELSRILLGPVASQLGRKRLLIVADGALDYVPFAALPEPGRKSAQPLVVDHELVSLPSASTLAVLRDDVKGRAPAPEAVAVLADPVFEAGDPRVTGAAPASTASPAGRDLLASSARDAGLGSGSIPRLVFTRREAEGILALVPGGQGMQALDFAADKAAAESPQLARYRILHFATHGLLDSEHPELSGLVLSLVDPKGRPQDGFLRSMDIFNLNLPAELVVLSACQTGLGKEIRGEGLVGMTRSFMYAGAPRVVVSLWSVNDQATGDLMVRFYRGMLGPERLRPAAALRAAQVSMWKDPRWRAPYYWAAFILQGEWK